MRLPDVYGYGSLFGFSGADGQNFHHGDFVAMTMPGLLTLRFDGDTPVFLSLPLNGRRVDCVLGDAIAGEGFGVFFAGAEAVVGFADVEPVIRAGEGESPTHRPDGVSLLTVNGFCYTLLTMGKHFAFCRKKTEDEALAACRRSLASDPTEVYQRILDRCRRLPACPKPGFERLWYKCLSIQRVNVFSPQDGIPCRFTTPDRLPHRHMWLWDSMFHAVSYARYDPALAKDAVEAVLCCQKPDGFLPHLMKSRTDTSSITQPPVVAWALKEIYDQTGDLDFVRRTAPKAAAFLRWFLQNRDKNGNGLPEWDMNFDSVRCRCDESGMDNSPRFDGSEYLDAVDAVAFLIHDARCLASLFGVLQNDAERLYFARLAESTAERMNALLWDETLGAYTDRAFTGKLTGVLTPASFLPMMTGFCPPQRAKRLVSLLSDPAKFGTPLPVPSVARDDPAYGDDMWRGGVWLNYNYMIAKGLKTCGYRDEAHALIEKTLSAVNLWYEKTGGVFEFYDPENRTAPWFLNRKGPQPTPPDYRKKIHAITDYHWSACFTLLMLSDG